ncbi:MAG: protein kinase, partial [Pseudomonadota bacterium]
MAEKVQTKKEGPSGRPPKAPEPYPVCPHCGARYERVPQAVWGKTVRCRQCQERFVVQTVSGLPQEGREPPGPEAAKVKTQRPQAEPARVSPVKPSQPAPTVRAASPTTTGIAYYPQADLEWLEGQIILGIYEIKGLLGQGGMGRVFLVHHLGWNLDMAVKTPTAESLAAAGGADDFEREAETWVNLGLHPHTVSCYYVRRVSKVPCLFSEYVSGGSLHDWIGALHDGPGRLYAGDPKRALTRILDVAVQFAWGLDYAHQQGLVHQDIKPANVLLTGNGLVKVTDFGLATARPRLEDKTIVVEEAAGQDRGSSGAGTPQYFSPEQAAGRLLTPKTDMWSFGLSLLEMFKGSRTWDYGSVAGEALTEYLAAGPESDWLPRMPEGVSGLLARIFNEAPQERPGDMAGVAAELIGVFEETTGKKYRRTKPAAGRDLADSLNNRAVSFVDLGRLTEAEGLWERALQEQPHHPESTFNRGLVLWRSGRLDDQTLLQQMMESERSHQEDPASIYARGLVHLERDDRRSARLALQTLPEHEAGREEVRQALEASESGQAESNRLLASLESHTGNVNSIALNRRGTMALSGGNDRILRVWNVSAGKVLAGLEGHQGPISAVCLSENGRLALSGGGDFTSKDYVLRLWDLKGLRVVRTLRGHEKTVNAVCLSRQGQLALSAGDDHTVRLWDLASSQNRLTLKAHDAPINAAWLSPDGRFFVSGGSDWKIKLWSAENKRCLRTFSGHEGRVNSLAVIPAQKQVLSASSDRTLKLWDMASGQAIRTMIGHSEEVNAVAVSLDGRYAVSGGSDQTLKLWDLENGKCLRTFQGHESWVLTAAFKADGTLAVSGGLDSILRVWQTDPSSMTYRAPMLLSRIAASESVVEASEQYEYHLSQATEALNRGQPGEAAKHVQTARAQPGFNRGVEATTLWADLYLHLPRASFRGGWEIATMTGHDLDVRSIFISRDGHRALSGSLDKNAVLWDVTGGKKERVLAGHGATVNAVALNPEATLAISGGSDKAVKVWEVETGRCLRTLKGHQGSVNAVCLSPDGRLAFSAGDDRVIKVWDIATGELKGELAGHRSAVNSLQVSLDGRHLLSAGGDVTGEDSVLKLWLIKTGENLQTFRGHERAVESACLSPDGRVAVSGSSDNTIKVWDTATGQVIRTLTGHDRAVNAVTLSADGRFILSGGFDHTLRLWDLEAGQCLRTFAGHASPVTSVALSLNGRYAVSGGGDMTVKVWFLDWNLGSRPEGDWDDAAWPWLQASLKLRFPEEEFPLAPGRLTGEQGLPSFEADDIKDLLFQLGCAGFGWL